jgi:hypothetical protein
LKSQIPIRTWAEWSEGVPGFVEVDLVTHEGGNSAGEAPGYWLGTASAELGLRGEVTGEALASLLRGRSPADGASLMGRNVEPDKRVAGFDLTFSAPKSVSLLFGLGQPEVSEAVRAAHDSSSPTPSPTAVRSDRRAVFREGSETEPMRRHEVDEVWVRRCTVTSAGSWRLGHLTNPAGAVDHHQCRSDGRPHV